MMTYTWLVCVAHVSDIDIGALTWDDSLVHAEQLFYSGLGRKLCQQRERCGFTQEDLAAKIGLTRTSITNIEKGRQRILLHTFIDLATSLGVHPEDLLPATVVPLQEIEDLLRGRSKKEREFVAAVMSSVDDGARS